GCAAGLFELPNLLLELARRCHFRSPTGPAVKPPQLVLNPFHLFEGILQSVPEKLPLFQRERNLADGLRKLYLEPEEFALQRRLYLDVTLWRAGELLLQSLQVAVQFRSFGEALHRIQPAARSGGLISAADIHYILQFELVLAKILVQGHDAVLDQGRA